MKERTEMHCNDMSKEDELTCGGAVAVIILAIILSAAFSVKTMFMKLTRK